MKIILCEHKLYNVGLGLLLTLNYVIEGLLMYGAYLLINHWIVTGEETLFWIFGAFFLMFVRAGVTGDSPIKFSFHLYTIWRVIVTIGYSIAWSIKKIPLSIEVRDD